MYRNISYEIHSHLKNKSLQKEFAIFAMFLNRKVAKAAIKSLKDHGFLSEDIILLKPEKKGSRDFAYHQGTSLKTGMLIGAVVGLILAVTIGFVFGASDRFRLGVASWVMIATLAGIIGLIYGAVAGALVGIGIPTPANRRYKFYLREGGQVVMLHLRNEEDSREAYYILEHMGGQDITILEESQVWSSLHPEQKKLTFH